jgi:metal-responsive CopG/Arc/MetJ family transcriptional regulator
MNYAVRIIMVRRKSRTPIKFSVKLSLPKYLLDKVDELAEDCDASRGEIVEDIAKHVLEDKELIDEVFEDDEED